MHLETQGNLENIETKEIRKMEVIIDKTEDPMKGIENREDLMMVQVAQAKPLQPKDLDSLIFVS